MGVSRAGPRLRSIRPLLRAPLLEKAPNLGALYEYIYIYWEILKHFSLHFFSLLRRLKELNNARHRDKPNLNK